MRIALLTPTGDRPEAFALCQRWTQNQTRQPDAWFVVDDGAGWTASGALENCSVFGDIKFLPPWDKPGTSQHRNMLALLDMAEQSAADAFVVIEDDDYYGPHYIQQCEHHLQTHELIGETPARYYNVRTRHWRTFQNRSHASLCQTAFRRSMIQPLRDVVATGQWIDMTFWPKYLSRGLLWEGYNVLGIKGMPGRGGVSNAHRETAKWGHHDADLSKLREWIGRDAEVYAQYVESNIEQQHVTNWCASCKLAVVAIEGDICERCSTAGAASVTMPTFTWGKPGREVTMYRCPEFPTCRFDASTKESIVNHLRGCVAREERRKAEASMSVAGSDLPLI